MPTPEQIEKDAQLVRQLRNIADELDEWDEEAKASVVNEAANQIEKLLEDNVKLRRSIGG